MIQRRLRVVKWLSTTPAVGVCTLCDREFKAPMSALKRTADAQASLQEQFDRHNCDPEGASRVGASSQASARVNADVLLRQEPDEGEDEEEDEGNDKEDDDDDDTTDDGYSE